MMKNVYVIPQPKSVELSGERISIKASAISREPAFSDVAEAFCALARKLYDLPFSEGEGGVEFLRDGALLPSEYRIDGKFVYASDKEGAFYGAATLLQLLLPDGEGAAIPDARITDRPDCPYRSLMLDLAFKFHTVERLKAIIDLCFLYKIRFLHLHFIDNKSYTLPSKLFPLLPTEGLSYTYDDIDEINAYAEARGIEIIPEIEFPGHEAAMIAAYPEVFGIELEDSPEAEAFKEKFANNVISVGREGMMDHVEGLIREVIAMFPNSRYLHVGGDEAQIEAWQYCRHCKKYMKEKGIDGVYALYSHFEKLVTDKVLELGRTPIVWEGFPKEGAEQISREVLVIAWESLYHLAPDLLEEGFKIVNASWQPLYLVVKRHWSPKEILGWNIYNWQNWWEKSYAYNNPINVSPTDRVLGGQISSWWGGNYAEEIDLIKNNLAALSERTWNIERLTDDEDFFARLDRQLPLADILTAE